MLYFLYGTDGAAARAKLASLIDGLRQKKPDASFFKLDERSFTRAAIEERIAGRGLFEERSIVLLDSVCENAEAKAFLFECIQELGESENIFVAIEREVDAATVKKIEKVAEKIQHFPAKEKKQEKEAFSRFAITDAFGGRKKREAWVLFQKMLAGGATPEEIHGMLFWQAKTMLLVKRAGAGALPEELGMKPFAAKKAASFAKHFTDEELRALTDKLVTIYHDARRGRTELAVALEQYLLSL